MQLEQVEISRAGARSSAAEYRKAAKRVKDPVVADEYLALAKVYDAAVKDDVALISLQRTLRAGGTMVRTQKETWWDSAAKERKERVAHTLLPKLAVCTSDARYVYTLGIERDGGVRFVDKPNPFPNYVRGRIAVENVCDFPTEGYRPADGQVGRWTREAWAALVPIVPPKVMPRWSLSNYVTLFEVDDWQMHQLPAPPGDPALLRHLGGDLYAVEATWDLTPLEQMVLTGRPELAR